MHNPRHVTAADRAQEERESRWFTRAPQPRYTDVDALVRALKWRATRGRYDGTTRTWRYLARCRALHVPLAGAGSSVIWTHDEGMHACGWWKNPEYERCYHLSLSFFDAVTMGNVPYETKLAAAWAERFLGDARRYVWIEGPFSGKGKRIGVHHLRVFVDKAWKPIVPRGEVYTREFTEAGWRSWGDIHGDDGVLDPKEQP